MSRNEIRCKVMLSLLPIMFIFVLLAHIVKDVLGFAVIDYFVGLIVGVMIGTAGLTMTIKLDRYFSNKELIKNE